MASNIERKISRGDARVVDPQEHNRARVSMRARDAYPRSSIQFNVALNIINSDEPTHRCSSTVSHNPLIHTSREVIPVIHDGPDIGLFWFSSIDVSSDGIAKFSRPMDWIGL